MPSVMLPQAIFGLHFLETLHVFVKGLVENGSYFALFSLLVACGLGLPIPEDIPLFTAGVMIAKGHMSGWGAPLVGWAGIMVGDTALYCVGATLGPKIISFPLIGRHITQKRLDSTHLWFERYGLWAIGLGRMIAGVRGAMVAVAGITGFNYATFFIIDGLAAIISGGLFMGLGYYAEKHGLLKKGIEHIESLASLSFTGAMVVLAILVCLLIWLRNRRMRARLPQSPASIKS